jgi:hypothetical protein
MVYMVPRSGYVNVYSLGRKRAVIVGAQGASAYRVLSLDTGLYGAYKYAQPWG